MKSLLVLFLWTLLTACGSGGPPPPDWRSDAFDLIERYKNHALKGDNTLAEGYFEQAVAATGGAGRVEDTARLWLVRCAVRRAMLIDDSCAEYRELAGAQGSPENEAYFRYLTLDWQTLDAARLPKPHTGVVGKPANTATLARIADPLSRLLAVSLLVQRGESDDAALELGTETASERGWKQPLLVYLELQLKSAKTSGDEARAERTERRLRLVENSLTKTDK